MAEGVAESDTNIMPMAGRARGQLSVPDKGYGGVYTYLIYISSLRLFTQLTRHVLRKRVGPRRGARAWANIRARATRDAHACVHAEPNEIRTFLRSSWVKEQRCSYVIRDQRDANVRDELA